MAVIVRTHGGLGNQIFQVLYARLFAELHETPLKEVHEGRYKHKFARSTKLVIASGKLTQQQKIISALRLPKIIQRYFSKREAPLKIIGDFYVDGYYQQRAAYEIFSSESISRHILRLKEELGVSQATKTRKLYHLRVGDFFLNKNDAVEHVRIRLNEIENESDIITNDEDLLTSEIFETLIKDKLCQLISTKNYPAEKVLRLMADYKQINVNNSTLAFWASLLSGNTANFSDERLKKLKKFLENPVKDKSDTL